MGRQRHFVALAAASLISLAGSLAAAASLGGVPVRVPELSDAATRGQEAFRRFCSICHGSDAGGTNSGPPLIHRIYRPDHHGDMAFHFAVERGVTAHHWPFGNMPPQGGLTRADVTAIIAYVRELQRANGIFYRPHRM